jgi:2-oxoisovalerate dehydrogenase E2 component (dihydrolipoyl transacylase)
MIEQIKLPQVGESIVEGTVSKWLKVEGDTVGKYDPLVEIVTDKVTIEVPSPASGVISKILITEGTTVAVGESIAEIEVSDTTDSVIEPPIASSRIGFLVTDIQQVGPTGGTPTDNEPSKHLENATLQLSPVVRKLASELKIDLSKIQGSGINGRITKNDILAYSKLNPKANKTLESAVDTETIPSTIRKTIADNMFKSYSSIPHAWTMMEVDVTNLVTIRNANKDQFKKSHGITLTYLPFFMKALVDSLIDNMNFNTEWSNNKIINHKTINLGIAVASKTGLVVPVVPKAAELNIIDFSIATNTLISKANTNKLAMHDIQNGTFTLNNTGALGSIMSKPLINPPEAGIITTESIQQKPVVINNGIAIRAIMNICLSFDHRINDGYEASKFLASIKNNLQNFDPNLQI